MKSKITVALGILYLFIFWGCSHPGEDKVKDEQLTSSIPFPERAKDMVIYEVNTRQYTPEGTFKAFETHLPRIRAMGVDILWLMPIQPIGIEKRKGSLGSYYSIRNYKGINEEYGSLDDLKSLINKAHEMGMIVILDWVANHTAWDHEWITNKPEYYTKDSLGNIKPPDPGWTDVADLNYDNFEMQNEMIEAMKYWITEADFDGFRCDVAWGVPVEFWNKAKSAIDQIKDVFMLAEADQPDLHYEAFHMTYGWELHHIMNKIGSREYNADSIEQYLKRDLENYGDSAFRMNFTSNHDENSWKGTVEERYAYGKLTFAVLTFTLQGMPLIYGGQEAGLNKRLRFFEKDTIDWSSLPLEDFYTHLIKFKKDNKAIWNGAYGATPKRINIDNSENIYAFTRTKDHNMVIVLLNLSDKEQSFMVDDNVTGTFKDLFSGKELEIKSGESIKLAPWEYFVSSNLEN